LSSVPKVSGKKSSVINGSRASSRKQLLDAPWAWGVGEQKAAAGLAVKGGGAAAAREEGAVSGEARGVSVLASCTKEWQARRSGRASVVIISARFVVRPEGQWKEEFGHQWLARGAEEGALLT